MRGFWREVGNMKKKLLVILLSCPMLFSACTGNGYDNFTFPQNEGKSTITPIDQHKIETHYEDHGEVLPTDKINTFV